MIVGENVSPNGERDTLSTSFQSAANSPARGRRRAHFFAVKYSTAAIIVTACPIMVASAAPVMPQSMTHTKV